jgi:hypothetical protein
MRERGTIKAQGLGVKINREAGTARFRETIHVAARLGRQVRQAIEIQG